MARPHAERLNSWLRGAAQPNLELIELDADTVRALVELGRLLRRIRADLEAEGYRFLDGIIVPPDPDL